MIYVRSQRRVWKEIALGCWVWLVGFWFHLGRVFSVLGLEETRKDLKSIKRLESRVKVAFQMVLFCPVLQRAII